MGPSRSQPLRNSYPLWSAAIAIAFMDERAGIAVLGGTLLVVAGVVLISWKPETLIISLIFLRGKEQVTGKTILGPIAVVVGTIAIALGK
jgi:drug/metabolite transporter (DMT)-like permease